jgi:PAS domain S-box-containing protein
MRQYRLQSLKKLYLLALGIVAFTFIASAVLMQYATQRNQIDLRLVRLSGRQSSLCQRLTEGVLALQEAPSPEAQQKHITEISQTLREWSPAQDALRNGNQSLGLPPQKNSAQVDALFAEIQPLHSAMTHALEKMLEQLKEDPSSTDTVVRTAELMMKLGAHYVELDRQLTDRYEEEAWRRLATLRDWGQGILFVGLLVVLLEFLLVFRPAIGHLMEMMDSLKTQTLEIQQANDCLQEALEKSVTVERALRESETRLKEAQRLAQVGHWELNLLTNTLNWSDEVFRIFEIEKAGFEASYEAFLDLIHPEDRETVNAAYTHSLETRQPYGITHRLLMADGRIKHVHEQCETFYKEAKPIRSIGTVQDITRQKKEEEVSSRLAQIVESTDDAIISKDLAGNITSWNRGAQKIFGYEAPEIVGSPVSLLIPPDRQEQEKQMAGSIKNGESLDHYETERVAKDGRIIPVSITASAIRDGSGKVVGISKIVRDITELKRSQERIRESEERYAELAEQSATIAWEVDPSGLLTYANKVAEKVLGYCPEELVGRTYLYDLHPESGREDFKAALLAAFASRRPIRNAIHPVVAKSGRLAWVSTNAAPHFSPEGALLGYRGSDMDVTERKAMEDHLLRTQRMESIGTLAAGIAHDLNNILTPIILSSGMLRSVDEPESREFLIESIERCATRGSEVVGQVLTFARGAGGERSTLSLEALADDMQKIAKETFPKNIDIQISLPPELWPVRANSTHLHQVILNLCINARDAMPEGGSLLISGENVVVDENFAAMMPDAAPGEYAVVAVRDSGTGIPKEIIGKIFDPFFTTKDVHKGTGLGLSTVIGIVRSYGGFVTVKSTEGKGTTFKVHLPRDHEEAAEQPDSHAAVLPQGKGETILVIDDEESIAETLTKVLVNNGHNVLTARTGEEALALYQEHGSKIDLVLTDIMMPGIDGVELSRRLKEINPRVKILASTGQSTEVRQAELNELGIHSILTKPYDAKTLLKTLAAAMR